jgi:hypothetical protein
VSSPPSWLVWTPVRLAKFWSPTAIRLNQGIPSILTTFTIVMSFGSGDASAMQVGPAISVTVAPTALRRAVRLRRIDDSIPWAGRG